uniref:BTB domain-containing protein n=1 Tax=Octopus bimaculoides TaxID=37653 RepID=A0A0L8GCF1_OCTBM
MMPRSRSMSVEQRRQESVRRMRRLRARETAEKIAERRTKNRIRMQLIRAAETSEKKFRRQTIDRIKKRQKRAAEASQETSKRIQLIQTAEINLLQTDNLMEDHYGKTEKLQNKMMYVMNNSSATVHIADESPLQPSAPKVQKRQINDQQLDDNWQINIVPASQVSAKSIQDTSHTTVQQHSSVAETSQIKVSKRKPVEKNPRKQIFVIADYQRHVMSNIASLWKDRKLCDASISNGSSAVMVHKVVLFAVCPKLLSVFSTNIHSRNFLVINFPEEVTIAAHRPNYQFHQFNHLYRHHPSFQLHLSLLHPSLYKHLILNKSLLRLNYQLSSDKNLRLDH